MTMPSGLVTGYLRLGRKLGLRTSPERQSPLGSLSEFPYARSCDAVRATRNGGRASRLRA